MATQTANPHPTESDDTVICAGCGHAVDSLNDLASIPDPNDGTQMIVWHVDCETDILECQRETVTLEAYMTNR